jgi:penicillin-binding protein 1A
VRRVEGAGIDDRNRPRRRRVLGEQTARTLTAIMQTVVQRGSGRRAAFGEFAAGKTGTTENSGDAWFVGFSKRLTVAVWVGYADRLEPMLTEFAGEAVEGGTYPALIWRSFMTKADAVLDERAAAERRRKGLPAQEDDPPEETLQAPPADGGGPVPQEGAAPSPATAAQSAPAPATPSGGGGGGGAGAAPAPDPEQAPAPAAPQATPEPEAAAPAEGGASAPPPG